MMRHLFALLLVLSLGVELGFCQDPSDSPDLLGVKSVPAATLPDGVKQDIKIIQQAYQTRQFKPMFQAGLPELTNSATADDANAKMVEALSVVQKVSITFADSAETISTDASDYYVMRATISSSSGANMNVEQTTNFLFRKKHSESNWYFMDCSHVSKNDASGAFLRSVIADLLAVYQLPPTIHKVNGVTAPDDETGTTPPGTEKPAEVNYPPEFQEQPITALPQDLQAELKALIQAHKDKTFGLVTDLMDPRFLASNGIDKATMLAKMTSVGSRFDSISLDFDDTSHVFTSKTSQYVFIATSLDFQGNSSVHMDTTSLFIKSNTDNHWLYVDCTDMAPGQPEAAYRTKYLTELPNSFVMPTTNMSMK